MIKLNRYREESASQEQFMNLVKQLPSEAKGVYLAGIGAFANDILWLTIAAFVGLAILVWIRARANVSTTIWFTSIVGYVIWVYAIGNGPFQAAAEMINLALPSGLGAFLVAVYTAIVGFLAVKPPTNG